MVENNWLAVPAPVVPVPGVPVGPGDQVKQEADKNIASKLQGAINDVADWLDKATDCSFGRACSSNGDEKQNQPNVSKELTNKEKAEIGGVGSGTGTPLPPENEPNKQNNKPTQNLNQKQESAIRKIDNTIKNGLKDHDITGTIKDMDGNPVPKQNGGSWDHMQEMQNTLRGLRNNAETLKNVNNSEAQAAYGRATDAINKIQSALKGHGI